MFEWHVTEFVFSLKYICTSLTFEAWSTLGIVLNPKDKNIKLKLDVYRSWSSQKFCLIGIKHDEIKNREVFAP